VVAVGAVDHLRQAVASEDMIAWQYADTWVIFVVWTSAKCAVVVVESIVIVCGDNFLRNESVLRGSK
jgi:hypothetical protein